jgi:hypothetical protein
VVRCEVAGKPARLVEEDRLYHANLAVKCDVEKVRVDFECIAYVEDGFDADAFLAGESVYSL